MSFGAEFFPVQQLRVLWSETLALKGTLVFLSLGIPELESPNLCYSFSKWALSNIDQSPGFPFISMKSIHKNSIEFCSENVCVQICNHPWSALGTICSQWPWRLINWVTKICNYSCWDLTMFLVMGQHGRTAGPMLQKGLLESPNLVFSSSLETFLC